VNQSCSGTRAEANAKQIYDVAAENAHFPLRSRNLKSQALAAKSGNNADGDGKSKSGDGMIVTGSSATAGPSGTYQPPGSAQKAGTWSVRFKFNDINAGSGNLSISTSAPFPSLFFKPNSHQELHFSSEFNPIL
jgi:hypothetical protein